ncbi:MAG: hypothetical protein KCHDKBKB_02426 [Elusimicrobia bacterium]|nr:hypothetical protein [Elusimicrobiota bacterium]
MLTNKFLLIPLLTCFLFFGCAGLTTRNNVDARGVLGVITKVNKNKFYVSKVWENSAAESMGLKVGDTISSFNGREIETRDDRIDYFDYIINSPHQPIELTVSRNGSLLTLSGTLGGIRVQQEDQVFDELSKLIYIGDNVSVAFVVDNIQCASCAGFNVREWKEGMKTDLLSKTESAYISAGKNHKNFRIVDRSKIEKLLAEIHFQMTGAVSPEQVQQIGKMSGASHIGFISFSRMGSANAPQDLVVVRLLDVKTGDVVASQRWD